MRLAAGWMGLLLIGACTESAAPREGTTLDPVEPGRELVDAATPLVRDAVIPVDPNPSQARDRDGGDELAFDAAASERETDAALDASARVSDGGPSGLADAQPAIDAAGDAAVALAPVPTVCAIAVDETGLPGVRIRIEGSRCTFRSGEGGTFRYHVELARSIAYRVADGFGGCGLCGGYGADPTSLIRATVGSDDIRYCATCDLGCCPPDREARHELVSGTTAGTLEWPGRSWNGPSDTPSPLGPAFPPGSYAVKVVLQVPGVGTAAAELPITVSP